MFDFVVRRYNLIRVKYGIDFFAKTGETLRVINQNMTLFMAIAVVSEPVLSIMLTSATISPHSRLFGFPDLSSMST